MYLKATFPPKVNQMFHPKPYLSRNQKRFLQPIAECLSITVYRFVKDKAN